MLEAIAMVSHELWLTYLRAKSAEVMHETIRAARDIARDRLLAMEGLRDTIGPHLGEMARLEVAWARLTQALEEVEREESA